MHNQQVLAMNSLLSPTLKWNCFVLQVHIFFKWKDSQRSRAATSVCIEMEKTQCSRPRNCPQVNHLPSYCIRVLRGVAFCLKSLFTGYESHFFPFKTQEKHSETIKHSIQILMILCNYFAATK